MTRLLVLSAILIMGVVYIAALAGSPLPYLAFAALGLLP